MAFHVARGCDADRLDCVLTVPDVGAMNGYAFEDGEEDGCVESGLRGQADRHQTAVRPKVVNGLGVPR